MNCGKSFNCLDRRMKIIILEKRSAECGPDGEKSLFFILVLPKGIPGLFYSENEGVSVTLRT